MKYIVLMIKTILRNEIHLFILHNKVDVGINQNVNKHKIRCAQFVVVVNLKKFVKHFEMIIIKIRSSVSTRVNTSCTCLYKQQLRVMQKNGNNIQY